MKIKSPTTIGFILVGSFMLVCFILLMVSPLTGSASENASDINNPFYDYVVIDGMPCLTFRGQPLTCDWDSWHGTVDGDKVILP